MAVLKNRKTLKAFAHKIFAQQALLDDEMLLVARALEAIGDGADANRAFGVKFGRGQKPSDNERRQHLSAVLHIVSAFVDEGMDVEPACNLVADKLSNNIYLSGAPTPEYEANYLYRAWYKHKHLQALDRTVGDADFPYGD
jgi:hypothetical protein